MGIFGNRSRGGSRRRMSRMGQQGFGGQRGFRGQRGFGSQRESAERESSDEARQSQPIASKATPVGARKTASVNGTKPPVGKRPAVASDKPRPTTAPRPMTKPPAGKTAVAKPPAGKTAVAKPPRPTTTSAGTKTAVAKPPRPTTASVNNKGKPVQRADRASPRPDAPESMAKLNKSMRVTSKRKGPAPTPGKTAGPMAKPRTTGPAPIDKSNATKGATAGPMAKPRTSTKPAGPSPEAMARRETTKKYGKSAGPMAKPSYDSRIATPVGPERAKLGRPDNGEAAKELQAKMSRHPKPARPQNTGPQEAGQAFMDRVNASKAQLGAKPAGPRPMTPPSQTSAMANLQAGMGAKPAGPRPPMSQTGSRQAMPPEPMMRRPMGPMSTPGGMRPPMGPMPTPGGMRPPMMSRMAGAAGPMMSRMAKGGKAKVSEYGGKEMYTSKAAMMKHEGEESMSTERKEGGMGKKAKMKVRGTGAAKKGNKFNR